MIDTIVFDVGRVIVAFDPLTYLREKYSDNEKAEYIHKAIFNSPEWPILDKGTITEEEALAHMCANNPKYVDDIKDSFTTWPVLLKPIEGTIKIIETLKKNGYKLYIISNFQDKAFDDVYEMMDVFKLFDGIIVSAKEKLVKPDPAIFKKLIERYSVDPQSSIFVDDLLDNVQTANSLGFSYVHFKSPEDLKDKLEGFGVTV